MIAQDVWGVGRTFARGVHWSNVAKDGAFLEGKKAERFGLTSTLQRKMSSSSG